MDLKQRKAVAASAPAGPGSRGAGARGRAGARAQQGDGGETRSTGDMLDLLEDSLGYAIKRAQVRTYEQLFAMMGPSTLSPGRMTALSIIGAQPGTNQSALAEHLRVTRASVVKVIDSLEALGLVERRSLPGDRRSYALVLTEGGRQELRSLHEKTQRYEARIAERLSPQERRQLISLLDRVAVRGDAAPDA